MARGYRGGLWQAQSPNQALDVEVAAAWYNSSLDRPTGKLLIRIGLTGSVTSLGLGVALLIHPDRQIVAAITVAVSLLASVFALLFGLLIRALLFLPGRDVKRWEIFRPTVGS